jgi:hypothetical protein
MKEIVLYKSEQLQKHVLDFCKLESWDDFETIAGVLLKRYKARSIGRVEGPTSKIWEFELYGITLKLINNPYGNSIYGETTEQEKVMRDIFDSWTVLSSI